MKKILIILLFLSPISVYPKEVYLDCKAKVTEILGENLYGKSSYEVGEEKLFRFDINLESETGKIPGWVSNSYSSTPKDPTYQLVIGEKLVRFGQLTGKHFFSINRDDLSFWGRVKLDWTAYLEGNCELIEKREAPKRAF